MGDGLETDDDVLVRRCRNGEEGAAVELYERHRAAVRYVVADNVHDRLERRARCGPLLQ